MSGPLIAGAAKMAITPPIGVDLCGYGGRPSGSIGVHDELCAGAIFVCDGSDCAVIITADLIGLSAAEVAEVRALVHELTDVPPSHVLVSCTHTHAGPATDCIAHLGYPDRPYLNVLKRQLASLARMARDHARPALFGFARQAVSVGANRRLTHEGNIVMAPNADGALAPYVDVWSFDDAVSGRPLARLFSHAAHAVTMGGDNLLISADWPGAAQRYAERIFPGAPALFAQGCCGDINSDPRGSFEVVERQGQIMAGAVAQADARAERRAEVRVAAASETVQLPLLDPPPVAEARARVEYATGLRDSEKGKVNRGFEMMYAGQVKWAERILELAEAGATGRTIPYEVQAISLGDAAWVGLPGEVFVEYALNIDRASPFAQTTVAAYANDNPGYVPTAAAYLEGGYEVNDAIQFYGDMMMAPVSEEIILAAAGRVLAAVR